MTALKHAAMDGSVTPRAYPAPNEPRSGLRSVFVGKALASNAFITALSKAASRLKHSEAERLLAIVADDLNAAIGAAGLDPLLEDEHAATVIVELLATGER